MTAIREMGSADKLGQQRQESRATGKRRGRGWNTPCYAWTRSRCSCGQCGGRWSHDGPHCPRANCRALTAFAVGKMAVVSKKVVRPSRRAQSRAQQAQLWAHPGGVLEVERISTVGCTVDARSRRRCSPSSGLTPRFRSAFRVGHGSALHFRSLIRTTSLVVEYRSMASFLPSRDSATWLIRSL